VSRLFKLLTVSLFLCFPAAAQDQAERLYDNAATFMSAGKYKEALTDFESILSGFAATPWAPKALLEIAKYYLDVEGDSANALERFSAIQSRYPQSPEAPAAYYFKARIMEREGDAVETLETAVADLIRMGNLYPGNAWESKAVFLLGKLTLRLGNFEESLKQFQRLEFSHPDSEHLPEAVLLSAKAACLRGQAPQAELMLARLQSKFPNSGQAEFAAKLLRLMSRFSDPNAEWRPDQTFFGAVPKKYNNPTEILAAPDGKIAIKDSRNAYFEQLGDRGSSGMISSRDLVEFALDREGGFLLVYENRIVNRDGGPAYGALNYGGGTVREIDSAAVDAFGRLHVVDGDERDVLVFTDAGEFVKRLGVNRPQLVRCFGDQCWALGSDDGFRVYDGALNLAGNGVSGLDRVEDFCFDWLGNLYVLFDRGNALRIYTRAGELRATFNFRGGGFPLKQADGVAVDGSGAIYLSDRRGGAVYRFH